MKKILFLLIASFYIVSCTQYKPAPIDYSGLAKNLTTGMTKAEVVKILGTPQSKLIRNSKESYYYSSTAESSIGLTVLNATLLLPFSLAIQKDTISEELGTSKVELEFDSNGKLEKIE